ncbi:MAG: short-chain fatty acid transporter [Roseivirga sp.]|nr:short-chain fatty acid transporter [Roseivirga sp.]
MQSDNLYLRFVRNALPSPFSIAVILTLLTFLLALIFTSRPENAGSAYPLVILEYWETGFWELLTFTMQMALILVLGHTLALTPFINRIIASFTEYCTNTASAALWISLLTIAVSFINWGLCLVFGAIFARKVAEKAKANGWKLNYPLIGAAGYSGMMCWHGGFSGSAPLTVAGSEHFLSDQIGQIGIEQTLLSSMNLTTGVLLLIIIPAVFYLLGKRSTSTELNLLLDHRSLSEGDNIEHPLVGAEKIDHSRIAATLLGGIICFIAIRKIWITPTGAGLSFINLNYINFFLFGLAVFLHGSFVRFLRAIQEAIGGSAGIIIQFPLYAGIMGIMKYSGLAAGVSYAFVEIANETTLPIFTFLSAGLVNIFVPSGGGQWAVQGPITVEAAQVLNVPIPKIVMALSYGDQLTNMLQPFWALPLLGITKLKAKDILPYSLIIMGVGLVLFITVLMVF